MVIGVLALCALQAGLVALGSRLDGTWYAANGGTTFLRHYGVWAVLASDPLLLLTTALAYRQFIHAMAKLPIAEGAPSRRAVNRILLPHLEFLHLRGRGANFYLFLVCVGTLGWIDNLHRTNDPLAYFSHDVFDSTNFKYGYYATKWALFNSWIVIYPAVGFVLISMSLSTRRILAKLMDQSLLRPSVLHPDDSFGFSELGKLNVYLLFPYLLSFVTLFAVMLTHKQAYNAALFPLIILSAIFVSISYLTIGPIVSHVQEARRVAADRLTAASNEFSQMDTDKKVSFATERLSYSFSSGSPYSSNTRLALLIMRLVPIAMTASRLLMH